MKLVALAAGAAAFLLSASPAWSGTIGGPTPSLSILATSDIGGDQLSPTLSLVSNGDGTYSASGGDQAPSFSILFDLTLNPDPSISGSFTLTNLSAVTQTFSVSATLGVAPIAGPTRMYGAYGGPVDTTTYTDANGDSSVTLAAATFYQAQIDGSPVASLGSFNLTAFGGPGAFGTISLDFFGPDAPGPAVASSIGVAFPAFSLTAGDKVVVPFEFSVVPEPGTAGLCAAFAAVFLGIAMKKSTQGNRTLW